MSTINIKAKSNGTNNHRTLLRAANFNRPDFPGIAEFVSGEFCLWSLMVGIGSGMGNGVND
jgi:hypothetical protein